MQLVARTGQMRKVVVGTGLVLGGFTIVVLPALLLEPLTIAVLLPLSTLAFGLAIAGAVYLCLAVRCRDCGARWFWLAASKPPGSPERWTHHSDRCPVCGSGG